LRSTCKWEPSQQQHTRRNHEHKTVAAGFFTYIFTKGFEGKPGLGEGLRYGLLISLFLYVPWFLTGLAFGDWTVSALFIRAIVGIVEALVAGAVVAQLCKPGKA
jgi:hypothetical protein